MCPAKKVKKFEFCKAPFGENFSSYLPSPKISWVQREWFRFEFRRPHLEDPPISYPQILSNFISLFLLTLKILCVKLRKLKSLNFGGPVSGEPPL